jgi:hypothetical protein
LQARSVGVFHEDGNLLGMFVDKIFTFETQEDESATIGRNILHEVTGIAVRPERVRRQAHWIATIGNANAEDAVWEGAKKPGLIKRPHLAITGCGLTGCELIEIGAVRIDGGRLEQTALTVIVKLKSMANQQLGAIGGPHRIAEDFHLNSCWQ